MDQSSPVSAVDAIQPEEVYNPGAISFVSMSWRQPELVTEVNGTGVLEAIRIVSGINRPSGDYVIGSGRMHSVRDAARIAFECVGPDEEEHVAVDPGRAVTPGEPLLAAPWRQPTVDSRSGRSLSG